MRCTYCEPGEFERYRITETAHWVVFLNPQQGYLGRCTIAARRHVGDIAELTAQEWSDLHSVLKELEAVIRSSFGAEMFNLTSMMNNAYGGDSPDPHVHWHLRPRYRRPVEFCGITFTDPQFAKHYDRTHDMTIPEEAKGEIVKRIKDAL